MKNNQTYTFGNENKGILDLTVSLPSKQVYQKGLPEKPEWIVYGLKLKAPDSVKNKYFFEWQKISFSYSIPMENPFVPPFEFRIGNRKLKESVLRSNVHLLTGDLTFEDSVGLTILQIRDKNNSLIFSLETEVFPQKMDYKSDYRAMLADITDIIHNLAFDSLKDTFRRSRARLSGSATENEWWNILDTLFESLVINLGVIKRQPKHEIHTYEKVQPVERIRQSSKRNIDWLRKNTHLFNNRKEGLAMGGNWHSTHALSKKKKVTYDTYENRFIAWAVREIIDRLRKYRIHVEKSSGNKDYSRFIERLNQYQGRLQGILHDNPFNEVGQFEKRSHFSTSLTRGAGYRDFMHIYLLLSRGLEFAENDIFKIEQKNISTLYEYWCYLMLVKLLFEQQGNRITYQDLIKIRAGKFSVELKKGSDSKVTFRGKEKDDLISIYFNKEFSKSSKKVFTFNQKPDYSIEFRKKGFEKPFWYIFDAKYRFEEKNGTDNNSYNVPQDTIGQLHRYRDAILHTELSETTYRKAIKNLGGIILYPFPGDEESFKKENIYYQSIAQVNIGAMPFLPGKTGLVKDFLKELINRSPESHFEEFIDMDRSEYDRNRELWKEWVTIGVLPKREQTTREKFLLSNAMFHIPFVGNLHSRLYLSKKLLICKAGTTEAFYADVKHWTIMSDRELKEKGANWVLRTRKYVVFHLENIKKITTPSPISPISFRYATAEGLKRYLKDPEENRDYFYMTNPDAARFYEELRLKNINFRIRWDINRKDPSRIVFDLEDLQIVSSEEFGELEFEIEGERVNLKKVLLKLND